MSSFSSRWSIDSPLSAADNPRMKRMLKVLLPTTLPRATSALPERAPLIDTAISGALVPNATTVRPMTIGATPNLAATDEAPRTSHSAPNTKATIPTTNHTNVRKSIARDYLSSTERPSMCAPIGAVTSCSTTMTTTFVTSLGDVS
ncbi:MAG: hypothetical protein RLZZ332_1564 [Actinomycetota bacterium]